MGELLCLQNIGEKRTGIGTIPALRGCEAGKRGDPHTPCLYQTEDCAVTDYARQHCTGGPRMSLGAKAKQETGSE